MGQNHINLSVFHCDFHTVHLHCKGRAWLIYEVSKSIILSVAGYDFLRFSVGLFIHLLCQRKFKRFSKNRKKLILPDIHKVPGG